MREGMWEDIANALVNDMVQREGIKKTIDFLLDCGCTKDEITDDLYFDTETVEEVMLDRGDLDDD